jgi:hypothetical protein
MSGGEPFAVAADNDRFARTTVRVALRQLRASEQSPAALAAWLSVHEHSEQAERDEPAEAPD